MPSNESDALANAQPTGATGATGEPEVTTPANLKVHAVLVGLHGIACLLLLGMFGLHPGDPRAFYVAAGTLGVVGLCGVIIAVVSMAFTRGRYLLASGLMWPHLLGTIWLFVQFSLMSPNPGGGTALGIIGLIGLTLGRLYAGQLRNYSLVKAYFPERLLEKPEPTAAAPEAPLHGGRSALAKFLIARPHEEEHSDNWLRDNVESVVIALVMALVIRTYSLEAFKIPTGSMKQTLIGDNKDTVLVTDFDNLADSALIDRAAKQLQAEIDAGRGWGDSDREMLENLKQDQTLGICDETMRADVIDLLCRLEHRPARSSERVVRSGDKILVNKLAYYFCDPKRWEVIVFKYPLNTKRNFIKRLTGLGGEELVVFRGDIWTRPAPDGKPQGSYQMERKPADVQAELWVPFYNIKYAGFTLEPREQDDTLYGIFPLRTPGVADDAPSWDLLKCPEMPDLHRGMWSDWTPADWVRADPQYAPQQYARGDRATGGSDTGDSRSLKRVWWSPPGHSSGGGGGADSWKASADIASLHTGQRTNGPVPGFVAAPSAEWSAIGFSGDVVDRFELPASRMAYDKLDNRDREDLILL